MKQKRNEGFSLIEVLVAIAILGIVVVPILSGLETSLRMNKRTEELLQAQLVVSSAVEQLMAEGITGDSNAAYDWVVDPESGSPVDRFPDVKVKTTALDDDPAPEVEKIIYYQVEVTDNEELVSVTTTIRAAEEGDA